MGKQGDGSRTCDGRIGRIQLRFNCSWSADPLGGLKRCVLDLEKNGAPPKNDCDGLMIEIFSGTFTVLKVS